jgi:hypothetical protein
MRFSDDLDNVTAISLTLYWHCLYEDERHPNQGRRSNHGPQAVRYDDTLQWGNDEKSYELGCVVESTHIVRHQIYDATCGCLVRTGLAETQEL